MVDISPREEPFESLSAYLREKEKEWKKDRGDPWVDTIVTPIDLVLVIIDSKFMLGLTQI